MKHLEVGIPAGWGVREHVVKSRLDGKNFVGSLLEKERKRERNRTARAQRNERKEANLFQKSTKSKHTDFENNFTFEVIALNDSILSKRFYCLAAELRLASHRAS
jgi:hypothetical protein